MGYGLGMICVTVALQSCQDTQSAHGQTGSVIWSGHERWWTTKSDVNTPAFSPYTVHPASGGPVLGLNGAIGEGHAPDR